MGGGGVLKQQVGWGTGFRVSGLGFGFRVSGVQGFRV